MQLLLKWTLLATWYIAVLECHEIVRAPVWSWLYCKGKGDKIVMNYPLTIYIQYLNRGSWEGYHNFRKITAEADNEWFCILQNVISKQSNILTHKDLSTHKCEVFINLFIV